MGELVRNQVSKGLMCGRVAIRRMHAMTESSDRRLDGMSVLDQEKGLSDCRDDDDDEE